MLRIVCEMKASEIRNRFLKFFEDKSHALVKAAPIVMKDDPTLMFTNAGMNQFKDYFLEISKPKSKRAADSQPCLRVSGKHNDLEDVGKDNYHHTMFEMLGNWSFGDYFKAEAIEWAWKFISEEIKMPTDRIYVSVFGGDANDGLEADIEAENIWKKFIPSDRILRYGKKDNFWEMGETGPCGPCSEIHIDLRSDEKRKELSGASLVNADDPEVIELWNLVFIEFNRKSNGELLNLPNKHVDTGMGLERVARVLQGVDSNYETDLFTPILKALERESGKKVGESEELDIAFRVISDHCRAVNFVMADGQLPSNTGAGYVIRRILRRAIRYGFTFLNIKEPFIYKLTEILAKEFSQSFPQIEKQKEFITIVILSEEESFLRTLEKGLQRLNSFISTNKTKELPGKLVFELYDTFGFPPDLTRLIAEERGLTTDLEEFDKEMNSQVKRARAATQVKTGDWVLNAKMPEGGTTFVGYEMLSEQVDIINYREITRKGKNLKQLIINPSPFYPEGGGQVGDKGRLVNDELELTVFDTVKENNLILLTVDKFPNKNLSFKAEVNSSSRLLAERNHSATHLMHAALRNVLGTHVEQKGSLVNADHLRFDFSHFLKMTEKEILEVERIVNDKISEGFDITEKRDIPIKDALDLGAMALFGEKYGDHVRLIGFDMSFSVELCGGTHVSNTAEIGIFKIISEGSISSGVRRIEARTSIGAFNYLNEKASERDEMKDLLKANTDPVGALKKNLEDSALIRKKMDELESQQLGDLSKILLDERLDVDGMKVLVADAGELDAKGLKELSIRLKQQLGENSVIVLGGVRGAKAYLTVSVQADAVDSGLAAGQLIRLGAKAIRGGGGGQANFASAGGVNPDGIKEALNLIKDELVK